MENSRLQQGGSACAVGHRSLRRRHPISTDRHPAGARRGRVRLRRTVDPPGRAALPACLQHEVPGSMPRYMRSWRCFRGDATGIHRPAHHQPRHRPAAVHAGAGDSGSAGPGRAASFAVLSVAPTVQGLFANAEHFVILAAIGGLLILIRGGEREGTGVPERRGCSASASSSNNTAPLIAPGGAAILIEQSRSDRSAGRGSPVRAVPRRGRSAIWARLRGALDCWSVRLLRVLDLGVRPFLYRADSRQARRWFTSGALPIYRRPRGCGSSPRADSWRWCRAADSGSRAGSSLPGPWDPCWRSVRLLLPPSLLRSASSSRGDARRRRDGRSRSRR